MEDKKNHTSQAVKEKIAIEKKVPIKDQDNLNTVAIIN